MSSSNSRTNLVAIAAVVILGLLGLSAYLFYANQNLKQTTERMAQSLNEKQQIYDELNDTYNEAVSELDEMKGNNEELNALIEKQKDELKAKKNQISSLIRSKNDLKKAKAEMSTMRQQLDKYIAEVVELKAKNEELMATNETLDNENKSLRTDLTAKSAQANELEEARAKLVSEKDALTSKNAALGRKVDIASVVKVEEIKATGWKIRKNGKQAKKKYAKNVDRLELCFNATENAVTNSGEETFQVRIINPTGETLAIEELGSGTMTDESTQQQFRYTTTKTIDYQNEEGQVCVDWTPNISFAKGIYTVEIFNKGYLAGVGEFRLK